MPKIIIDAETKAQKLVTLAHSEGYDTVEEMLEDQGLDCSVPAICMTPGCDYTTPMEPDQTQGWCECCNKGTVVSMLKLANVI